MNLIEWIRCILIYLYITNKKKIFNLNENFKLTRN